MNKFLGRHKGYQIYLASISFCGETWNLVYEIPDSVDSDMNLVAQSVAIGNFREVTAIFQNVRQSV